MDAGAARALARLDPALVAALGPEVAAGLPRAVAAPAEGGLAEGPEGQIVVYAPSGGRRCRVLELDRDGTPLTALRWRDGALAAAWVRVPDGSWLALEPRVTAEAPWGLSDGLGRAAGLGARGLPLTVFEALDWSRIDRIPTLADPAALPIGGGVAILNLIATLAADQGRAALTYRGPYPSETLFLALLEAFRYAGGPADPLADFTHGTLDWLPAPHARRFTPEGAYVQQRGRIEKVIWRGRVYYRPDWQGVARHAPRRVHDAPDGVRCSLWALGTALEDHLLLTAGGDVVRLLTAPPPPGDVHPLPAPVAAGLGAILAALSAAPLGPAVRAVARSLAFEWRPVAGDLLEVGADRVGLSTRLQARLRAAVAEASGPGPRAALALAALSEIALLLGDALRARALGVLATQPEAEQRALLESPPPPDPADARSIADAVEALLDDAGP